MDSITTGKRSVHMAICKAEDLPLVRASCGSVASGCLDGSACSVLVRWSFIVFMRESAS